ncbi:MAG: UvrB/UvrC motif-containing protein [Opitutales bacterium]
MANSLKCDLCKNTATVHLTQILNNKIHKVDLCESCAQKKGVTDPNGFSLADLLVKSPAEELGTEGAVRCGTCGFTQNEFKKRGRFGCPDCYDSFSSLLKPVLETMHKGTTHYGKVPAKAMERKSLHEKLSGLEEELKSAVESERYEDAACFRDQINEMKKTLDPSK